MASDEVNRLGLALGGGLTWEGPLESRPEDVVGLGVVHARNGSPFLRARESAKQPMERAETVLELSYLFQAGEGISLQPDLQWVRNPGTDPGVTDALVLGIRGRFLLELPFHDPGS